MKKLRIYTDTSVLGGCFDPEFAEWSLSLMADFRARRFEPLLSDVVAAETAAAPEAVGRVFRELLDAGAEVLGVGAEALALLAAYRRRRILGERFTNDMLHIALATIARADVLVSWNFQHIVRFDKIRAFNAVNIEQGHAPIAIHSPREVTSHEKG